MRWGFSAPAVLCAAVAVACGGHTAASASTTTAIGHASAVVAPGDWLTFDYDSQRNGVGPSETGITASNLGQLTLRTVEINGIADSSAVELSNVDVDGRVRDLIAVTTSYGKTVAIDPATGTRLWEFVPRGVNASPGNPQVTTSTPVVDPDRRYLYSASPDGVVHKLSVATGHQVWSRRVTFDPVHEKIASALNISGPYLVVVTGGYDGDIPPYDGHVVTIYRSSGRIAHVWNTECSNRHRIIRASSCPYTNTQGDNAIWGRAGAVIEPGNHRILVATGNGPFNGSINWGDSVLELSPDASRLLHNWTPTNELALDNSDTDVGSTSPALLPTYGGLRMAIQSGKDGILHLLNLARLDGTRGPAGRRLGGQLAQTSSPGGGEVLTQPAVWDNGGRVLVFVGDDSGTGAYALTGGRHPRLRTVWEDSTPATSPVIAGGLLFVYDEIDGRLLVRAPASGAVLRSMVVPRGHWDSPIVVGGRIILPTGSYHDSSGTSTIDIFHLRGR
ncbi:MAG: PQQ-binding-like beta-propeller repeat protein [Solirubrobacteraceae bacterium]